MEIVQQMVPSPSLRLSEGEEQWIGDQGKGGNESAHPPVGSPFLRNQSPFWSHQSLSKFNHFTHQRHFYCSHHKRNTKIFRLRVRKTMKKQVCIFLLIYTIYSISIHLQNPHEVTEVNTVMFSIFFFHYSMISSQFLLTMESFYHTHNTENINNIIKLRYPDPVIIDIQGIPFTFVLLLLYSCGIFFLF